MSSAKDWHFTDKPTYHSQLVGNRFCGTLFSAMPLVGTTAPSQDVAAKDPSVNQLTVTVDKSLVLDSPVAIKRISFADGALLDVQAVNPKQILINGKAAGNTSLILWQEDGTRLVYDLHVRSPKTRGNQN
jgi:pilus assembly protein CpaC